MKRITIKLQDGYANDTVLLFADPLETDGQMVKLQCAEPGRGHLFRWALRVVVDKLVAQKKANIRKNDNRRERDQIRRDCGLVRHARALGGVYWE